MIGRSGFDTQRLRVDEWHTTVPDPGELAAIVATILRPATTEHLPAEWAGDYDADRAHRWVTDRDAEGITSLALDRTTDRPVALLLATADGPDIRLGYVLATEAWGRGLATELVEGFVTWCRGAGVASIVAGVEAGNPASVRVLEKTGFTLLPGAGTDELVYRRSVGSDRGETS